MASVVKESSAGAMSLVLGGILSVQVGAAFATGLFDDVGPAGTVFLRLLFAALVLMALWRPTIRIPRGADRRGVVWLGLVFAAMNLSFYLSIDRIPLGIAVTLEFIGPLGVAVLSSRRRRDQAWAGLAGVGLLLLSPGPGSDLDMTGCGLALFAGLMWGCYILLTERVGQAFAGGGGLAIAMTLAAVIVLPVGIVDGGAALLDARILVAGLAVAVLSSAIPYSLEMEALRHLPAATFGVLMSLEPAAAAAVGWIGLGQALELRELMAIALVLVASAGAMRAAASTPAPTGPG